MSVNRWFYRCTGCLEVVALADTLRMEYSVSIATCSTCDQRFELMGRVAETRLLRDRIECVCDERCTFARGPICVCHCGGENHGIGMAGYVTTTTDIGKAPRVTMPNTTNRAKALRQYREYAAAAHELKCQALALVDRKRDYGYLPRPEWDRMNALQRALRDSYTKRSHAGRMKSIAAFVPQAPPPPPLVIVTAPEEPLTPTLIAAGRLF